MSIWLGITFELARSVDIGENLEESVDLNTGKHFDSNNIITVKTTHMMYIVNVTTEILQYNAQAGKNNVRSENWFELRIKI